MRLAAAQLNALLSIETNLADIERLAAAAKRRRADVLLLPECATTGYHIDFTALKPAPLREALHECAAIAARHGINLLVGSPLFHRRKLYNCLLHFDRQGIPRYAYAKSQLTPADKQHFTPGSAVALFKIDGTLASTIICHERRYPELPRLAAMAGARILFHPNAGLDKAAVSRTKHNGNDGIPVRAFENAIYYAFANTVGPQGKGKHSAGDSKIVAPDGKILALAGNQTESLILATCDLAKATRKYPKDSLQHPKVLQPHWRTILRDLKSQAEESSATLLSELK